MATPLSIAALPFIFASFLIAFLYTKRHRRRSQAPAAGSPPAKLEISGEKSLLLSPLSSAGGEDAEKERKKKRGRKKRMESRLVEGDNEVGGMDFAYPFSSYGSATQRRIKVQYDKLVESNQAKTLNMAQLGQFVSCLVDARDELQHKSEIIQRSFKIKRALLFKADKSSFDRLCQQVYKLEAEHKRIEEDAAVYNLFQEQLKLSPAYKMLEVGASTAPKDAMEEAAEFSDISFEELLAQEKKDSFWQRNGKLRSAAD